MFNVWKKKSETKSQNPVSPIDNQSLNSVASDGQSVRSGVNPGNPVQSVDGKIVIGQYSYDQADFWKGRIPGVRQTYPFPRTRPIIFNNKIVGMPAQFGPYGKFAQGPPSPPPPTPVGRNIFPPQPGCCCIRLRKKKQKQAEDTLRTGAFGIYSSDPNADFSLGENGFHFCSGLTYHISPQFRYKKFQRRYFFIMTLFISLSFLPTMATLFVTLYIKSIHQFLLLNVKEWLNAVVFGACFSLYMLSIWFAGSARYRPWPLIVFLCRMLLSAMGKTALAILTEEIYVDHFANKDFAEPGEERKSVYDAPNSVGYWPFLAFIYQLIFSIPVAVLTRFSKTHYTDFAMKVELYFLLWVLFCLQGVVVFGGFDFGILQGPRLFDVVQSNLALFYALLNCLRTLKNFRKLFSGKLCTITEREYLYCLVQLAA